MDKNIYPAGWNNKRVRKVIDDMEARTEEEIIAEDEAPSSRIRRASCSLSLRERARVREMANGDTPIRRFVLSGQGRALPITGTPRMVSEDRTDGE